MWVKKQQSEQRTGSTLGKEYKTVYCHPTYLISLQSTSCKMRMKATTNFDNKPKPKRLMAFDNRFLGNIY